MTSSMWGAYSTIVLQQLPRAFVHNNPLSLQTTIFNFFNCESGVSEVMARASRRQNVSGVITTMIFGLGRMNPFKSDSGKESASFIISRLRSGTSTRPVLTSDKISELTKLLCPLFTVGSWTRQMKPY